MNPTPMPQSSAFRRHGILSVSDSGGMVIVGGDGGAAEEPMVESGVAARGAGGLRTGKGLCEKVNDCILGPKSK